LLNIEYPENEELLLINGNLDLLEIAFRNLIDNALKFSNDEIEVMVAITDKYINIRIIDHGIGIPSDEYAEIPKPFERGTNARFIGGFGVGLSIVKQIIELHSAEINITSKENVGTSIELVFIKSVFPM
jgi:two-component system, OmpR family, sensor histidine kinase ArlS